MVREGSTDIYHYTYTDHLGSILTATNSAGTVTAEQNFDAWGRPRHPSTWTYASVPTPPTWLYRGFTGHEHLPQFSLVNMNGRLYDPLLARMLSTDNYVQMPGYTQNYNRYSYVLNNPLQYTDPSGEIVWFVPILIGAAVGGIVNGVVHAKEPGGFWKGFAIGAVAGGITAATGGAVIGALGLSSTGIVSGVVAGASGAVVGSPIQGMGNAIVFGDNYSLGQLGKDILIAGAIGGVVGGAGATLQNIKGSPTNIWWGRASANGKGIWSISNKPKLRSSAFIEIDPIIGYADELNGGQPFTYSKGSYGVDNVRQFTTSKSIDVYRSISLSEYQDIIKNGFRPGQSSYSTGKLFASNFSDAKIYNATFNDHSMIIKARIPSGVVVEKLFGVDGLDYIYNVPLNSLKKVKLLTVFK